MTRYPALIDGESGACGVVRANPTLDEGVVAFIDGEARRRRMTRTAFVESCRDRGDALPPRVAAVADEADGRQGFSEVMVAV